MRQNNCNVTLSVHYLVKIKYLNGNNCKHTIMLNVATRFIFVQNYVKIKIALNNEMLFLKALCKISFKKTEKKINK